MFYPITLLKFNNKKKKCALLHVSLLLPSIIPSLSILVKPGSTEFVRLISAGYIFLKWLRILDLNKKFSNKISFKSVLRIQEWIQISIQIIHCIERCEGSVLEGEKKFLQQYSRMWNMCITTCRISAIIFNLYGSEIIVHLLLKLLLSMDILSVL